MVMIAERSAHWEIDNLQISGRVVFITGWLLAPHLSLDMLQLRMLGNDGLIVGVLPLINGQGRPDVQNAYPGEEGAEHCGFVGVGAWPREFTSSDRLQLEGLRSQEVILRLTVGQPTAASEMPRLFVMHQILRYGRRTLRLLLSGQWKSLIEKLNRQLGDRPQSKALDTLPVHWIREINKSVDPGLHLVIDHRLGGGANHYREELVQDWINRRGCIMILTYHLAGLQPMLQLIYPQGEERLGLRNWTQLPALLAQLNLREITYNTAVSLADPQTLAKVILQLRHEHKAKLKVLMHDFYLLCPSHFLINQSGQFCGIPGQNECAQCLPNNKYGFTSLFGGDLQSWRQIWGQVLQLADTIIAFSNDSAQHLQRAYQDWPDGPNWLQDKAIEVLPHNLEKRPIRKVEPSQHQRLVIGVVGQIGYHKGSAVVQGLAAAIAAQGGQEQICIIGSLEASTDGKIVKQTGPYKREQLADWIEQSGVNVMLFPSIWPETFSYVTQELIEMNLPLACFNLGAPAERIRHYRQGLVLDSQDPQMVLNALRELFHSCYQTSHKH
jgi:glycosyltransferase involved in cell wall biosynthesis